MKSCSHNFLSAELYPTVVDRYLAEECNLGRIVQTTKNIEHLVHLSPFGIIPKKCKQGKWRLIVDQHHQTNRASMMESLSYTSVDEVVYCIIQQGRGTLLAKVDIKQAYRNVPVHPDDCLLLGMKRKDCIYIDKVLPFGLYLALIIFSTIADALQWMMEQRGESRLFHYLDDSIIVGQPGSSECSDNLHVIQQTCAITGTPLEREKIEGPAMYMLTVSRN